MRDITPMLIKVANGPKMISSQRAEGFTWFMQGKAMSYPVKLLDFEGNQLVLGEDWLKFNNALLNYTCLFLLRPMGRIRHFQLIFLNVR